MPYTHMVAEGKTLRLEDISTSAHNGLEKEEAAETVQKLGTELSELHDLLFAAGTHSLLIVLQGRDTSGKDGLIRHLLGYINAQSCAVVPFKQPEPHELAHDYLWRIHLRTPQKGWVALFNRSHYEDVLVVRVHNMVPEKVWRKRYEQIRMFEEVLSESNTIILKFFLHISKDEQKQRLLAREQDTTKAWKLAVGDWEEREDWDAYTEAYEDALSKTSTETAPWYVVPADHKWFRDLAVTERIVEALRPYRKDWMAKLEAIGETAKADLERYRQEHGA